MAEGAPFVRSPLLLPRDDSALVIVDAQEKLLALIPERPRLVWNIQRIAEAALILDIPVLATEQYPQKLGSTAAELIRFVAERPDKLSFSSMGCPAFVQQLQQVEVNRVVLVGIETHVCVLQTALDLLAEGYQVYVAIDAVGCRYGLDHEVALRRMDASGVTLTTVETTLFEWCQVAGTDKFKQISAIVRRSPPQPS